VIKVNKRSLINLPLQFVPGLLLLLSLTACSGFLPAAGPLASAVVDAEQRTPAIQLVDITDGVTRKLLANQKLSLFSETFVDRSAEENSSKVGAGDVLEVSIWEAPPAALFGAALSDPRSGAASARASSLPEQVVSHEGTITIPFGGDIQAAGRTIKEIEADIVLGLKGKANQPQVLVRRTRNFSSNVTVVGEVTSSLRMPLTPQGERLLDVLAAAGGVRQPVSKMTLQITRGNQVKALPLETIIVDPRQNIRMLPGDVVTALSQPYSFTILGATGKNEEINFEAKGISLAQALARAGGLIDSRADSKGVFIFRFEDDTSGIWPTTTAKTPEGKVPVVYRADLKDPATFFVAQSFPIRDKDLLFVSNAPAAELQKFLNLVMSITYPILSLTNQINLLQ
jgi:polysaccharide biosynthesis/export protein